MELHWTYFKLNCLFEIISCRLTFQLWIHGQILKSYFPWYLTKLRVFSQLFTLDRTYKTSLRLRQVMYI